MAPPDGVAEGTDKNIDLELRKKVRARDIETGVTAIKMWAYSPIVDDFSRETMK